MRKIGFIFFTLILFSTLIGQNSSKNVNGFKGTHYALYTKCGQAITFCELTQQQYTSCGSVKNCYGLYVMPGDTFLINIEDKTQSEILTSDMSFDNFLTPISGFTFQPIDNNCIPQQALQICIPLNAISGSSFQIAAQNTYYTLNTSLTSGDPPNYYIYVGGQQPQFTFALSDFTVCPIVDDVSIEDNEQKIDATIIYPNPVKSTLTIFNKNLYFQNSFIEIKNHIGQVVFTCPYANQINISSLSAGMYFFTITNKNSKKTIKIIKE